MQRTRRSRRPVLLLLAAGLPLAACAQKPAAVSKEAPVQVEPLGQGGVSRVTLTERAAARLGIRTTPVREEQVVRTRAVGGEVVGPWAGPISVAVPLPGAIAGPAASGIGAADLGAVLVRVRLLESDLEKVDRSRSVRLLPIEGRSGRGAGRASLLAVSGAGGGGEPAPGARDGEDRATGLLVRPVEAPAGDAEGAVAALYYVADGPRHGLAPAQRVLVELPLGAGEPHRVIPYSAVLYDLQGEAWAYTSPQPRVFVRQRVSVDYIDGERAVLLEGPPVGAAVVTVGATELFGAESGVGKH